jgi:hypothetical protein
MAGASLISWVARSMKDIVDATGRVDS